MKMSWVLYSLLAATSLGIMLLIYKKLLLLGVNQLILNFIIFGLTFLGFFSIIIINKTPIKMSPLIITLFIIAAIFSLLGNYLQVKAFNSAPNIGYAAALVSISVILATLLSVLFFKSEFDWIKFLGILLAVIGAYLVSI